MIKVCQWLATGRWFSPVSATNKTHRHDTTEILSKVALNTIILTLWKKDSTLKLQEQLGGQKHEPMEWTDGWTGVNNIP
jgi:hypothetical protein